jgi:polyhydroxybutyrate depolymerase
MDSSAFIPTERDMSSISLKIYGWNGGKHRPGGDDPNSLNVDDVKFTSMMLDELEKELKIDKSRVYAAGMSMGAIMVYRLASELSERIVAIAAIAGAMGEKECHPKYPVSIIDFHGTDDPAVPLEGGKGKIDPSGADYISVKDTIDAWVAANHCDVNAIEERLPDRFDDGTEVFLSVHANGNDGSEIAFYRIVGGGHTWPGREFAPELAILGKSSKEIEANEVIWDFFAKHSRSIAQ